MMNSDPSSTSAPPRGRRPGTTETRDAILAAARTRFAAQGLDRTTIRAVAADAGVDAALVTHYFGNKMGLFTEAMRFPFAPEEHLPRIIQGDPAGVGRRLAEFARDQWESPASRERLLGILRTACSDPEAARALRNLIERDLFGPITQALGLPDAELRAGLCASQIVGLGIARFILGVGAITEATADDLVAWTAPTLQRYLTDYPIASEDAS